MTGTPRSLQRNAVMVRIVTALSLAAALGCNPLDPLRVVDDRQPITSIKVSPAETTVVAGDTVRFTVEVLGAKNAKITDRTISWSVGNPIVASVTSDSGLVMTRRAGRSEVLATVELYRAVGVINVTAPPAPPPPIAGRAP